MSQLQVSRSNDPLAALRIDRSNRPRGRPAWFGKVVAVLVVLGLVAAGAAAWQRYGEPFTRPQVKVAAVEVRLTGDADAILSAQGYLKSEKQAAIGAKVAGRVLKIYVKEGQPVAAHFVLAELEHADIDETMAAMKAALEANDASLEAMRVSVDKAKAELAEVQTTFAQDEREYTRSAQIYRSRGVSASEYEQAESKRNASRNRRDSMTAGVALGEARIREAEARQRESQARFRETEQLRQNLFVRAPFKGIVISKEAEEGESIMPGGMGAASGRGSVVTLADLLHLEVETDVKEDYVSRVKKDQRVTVAVDAVPSRRFGGRVRTIIPMGDRAKGTVKVKVQLDETEVRDVNKPETETFLLFPEMAATVHFLGEGKRAASGKVAPQVYAPAAAVQSDASGSFVWKVSDHRLQRIAIEGDVAKDNRVLVRRGLQGGEKVVLDPPDSLREDMLVKILP